MNVSNDVKSRVVRALNRLIKLKRYMKMVGIELTLHDLEISNLIKDKKNEKFEIQYDQLKNEINIKVREEFMKKIQKKKEEYEQEAKKEYIEFMLKHIKFDKFFVQTQLFWVRMFQMKAQKVMRENVETTQKLEDFFKERSLKEYMLRDPKLFY